MRKSVLALTDFSRTLHYMHILIIYAFPVYKCCRCNIKRGILSLKLNIKKSDFFTCLKDTSVCLTL
jgi:hypothetical protein